MKLLILWIGILIGSNIIPVKAQQEAEKFALWPNGPKENNGLQGGSAVDAEGRISGNNDAQLYVYHPVEQENCGKAVIICPGGGYASLAMKHEGELFARWLNQQGITAIVLQYRMPNGHYNVPVTDAVRAMKWVRSQAEEWGIDSNKVGISGFSAGGSLASIVATHFDTGKPRVNDRIERFSSRPDFLILFYPVISMMEGLTHAGSKKSFLGKHPSEELVNRFSSEKQVSHQTPPVFLVHCDDDKVVSPLNSVLFYQALKKQEVPAVLYIFPKGGHGWGVKENFDYYQVWTFLLKSWLAAI